ncbi:DUF2834 domain-containing protein [Iningainema tapete]|uniref:DUF2834 domain-containing protein n=1 Tax=Iningainema tapete BLCC-T55 TaxID=2748662 RepID=A0A8J6XNX9_9CYAN|nr:DUF2834 domain-containing protein [Iningainema tapete BLCC-T55]
MLLKVFYAILCVFGTILPYTPFVSWLSDNGLNLPLAFLEVSQSRMSAFAWFDVLLSACTLLIFVISEGNRHSIRHWWMPIIATLTVGVSLGLPLFLLLREIQLNQSTKPA